MTGALERLTESAKSFIKTQPRAFDTLKRLKRHLSREADETYRFFRRFSQLHDRRVTFIQIGANDGLRNDPIREHVVADGWTGIFVEPLQSAYELLRSNYQYIDNRGLVFVNAAISTEEIGVLTFHTFTDEFLATQSLEKRLNYLRKASFDREHVMRFTRGMGESIIREVDVPTLSIETLVERHWTGGDIDLLVVDAEGHEGAIIGSLNFQAFHPQAIFFESHNLGSRGRDLYDHLASNGYTVEEINGDSIAVSDEPPFRSLLTL